MNARRLLIALLLAVLVYGAFVVFSGLETIRASLEHFHWLAFAAAIALASINYGIRFLRWQYYLTRLGVSDMLSVRDSALVFLSGFTLTVTPGKVGEVFKSAVLKRTHGVPVSHTAPIVIAERLTDVLAIVVLILIGSATFSGGLLWAAAGTGVVALIIGFIVWPGPMKWILGKLAHTRFERLVPKLSLAYQSLRQLSDVRSFIIAVTLSVFGWSLEGLALLVLLTGFGVNTTFGHAAFFYATATLAGALVPVPGGLGVTEAIMHEQMVRLGGVSLGDATASMMLTRFATLWWAVVVGFAAFALLRLLYPAKLASFTGSPTEGDPEAPV